MPVFWPASRVAQSKRWIARGRARLPGRSRLEITLGLPTFVGDDNRGDACRRSSIAPKGREAWAVHSAGFSKARPGECSVGGLIFLLQ